MFFTKVYFRCSNESHSNPWCSYLCISTDSWRKRYKSLALHDPVWYDHLPYIEFPAGWPVFSPKDKIGDWLEMYAKVMELNFWGSTTCKSAVREGDGWAVVVDRAVGEGMIEEITLRPRQL